jgi:phosphoglycolate phosphatase
MKEILIRAAAFDLDGTLLDTAPDLAAAANAMLETLGHTALPERRVARLIGGGIDRLVDAVLAESTGHPAEPVALARAAGLFRRRYAQHLFERSRLYSGVVEGLRGLRALGIKLCCVTNKHSTFTLPLLDAAGLAGHFAFALCADRAEVRKPAPDLLLAACERFEIEPCELLYVGDSRADIAAARAARCSVALVNYGYDEGASLADERPDWLIGSLRDLVVLPTTNRLANTEA